MQDSLATATNSMRVTVTGLKRKILGIKSEVELYETELDKLDSKFDKVVTEAELYKTRLNREMGREVKRLELVVKELTDKLRQVESGTIDKDPLEIQISSTISIIECILRHICYNADDFRLMSYAILFPAVVERVVEGDEPDYFLEDLPAAADLVVQRGKEYLKHVRGVCDTHVTDPDSWNEMITMVSDWWTNDALPLLYGCRDEKWELDTPYSLKEMLIWRDDPAGRVDHFSNVYDAYEIYKRNKEDVVKGNGVREYDFTHFQAG